MSELLAELEKIAESEHINTRIKSWPMEPSVLSRRLGEVKSNLEGKGIFFDIRPGTKFKKITLERRAEIA